MDTYPIPARSLERYFKIDGSTLEKNYRNVLSGYFEWNQKPHASDWMLLAANMGTHLSIDESMHGHDLFTFLSNKDGHGKKRTLIASVRGTRAEDVIERLKQIPEAERLRVEEVTMDFSESMHSIVSNIFPNAIIVIDNFHISKLICDGINEIRMRLKRDAVAEQKREKKEFERKRMQRRKYQRAHPSTEGSVGRPRLRVNEMFRPAVLSNGDTKVELFTRARHFLSKSGDKWSERQAERAKLLFEHAPELKTAFSLISEWRHIFANKKMTRETARTEIEAWGQKVVESGIEEMISAWDTIRMREEDVLNFFVNRSTNAAAESLNAKMKGFRSELRGVRDLPFFFYRCSMIFG